VRSLREVSMPIDYALQMTAYLSRKRRLTLSRFGNLYPKLQRLTAAWGAP
jgi:hypothetical protein